MYSPKIRPDLIPRVYAEARRRGLAMTTWVNEVIERALTDNTQPTEQRKENDRYEHNRTRTPTEPSRA